MKPILFLFLIFTWNSLVTAQTLADAKEFHALSKKMCQKMSTCMKEKLKEFPPEQRKMFESQFNNGNVCEVKYKNYVVEGQKPSSQKEPVKKLTKKDIEDMKECAKAMSEYPCSDLNEGKVPDACERFQDAE